MATNIWSVLCKSTAIDRDTNTLSLFEIIEGIEIQDIPKEAYEDAPIQLSGNGGDVACLVSYWWRDDPSKKERAEGRCRVIGPNKKEIYSHAFKIDLTSHSKSRHILRFSGLLFCGPGIYQYTLQQRVITEKSSRWRTVAKVPLDMRINNSE